MNPGCCFKSVIFIWSVEQGWPQPDSSQTKIISYIPFPQVCPVGLDTENEVNQVKDVVMLLGLIRLSQSAGQSDHRHSPQGDSGEHLPPPPSGLRREISRDIVLRLETCLLSLVLPQSSPEQQELSGAGPTLQLSSRANMTDCDSSKAGYHLQHGNVAQVEFRPGHNMPQIWPIMMRSDKTILFYSFFSTWWSGISFWRFSLPDWLWDEMKLPNWLRWDEIDQKFWRGEETGSGSQL